MITQVPNPDEYKDVAIDCLVQAYNNIYQVDSQITPTITREELWAYNQIVLRTAIVLIHQGAEGLMKSKICEVSPLLIIDKRRSEWKTLPNSSDESFADMYTIGGDDLIRTFYACIDVQTIGLDYLNHFEEIRVKRNKIIHGLGSENLTPEYVLKLILWTFTHLLGKDSFWKAVLYRFYTHPGLDKDDPELEWEEMLHYNRMEHLDMCLGKGELKKHFSIDITARPYLCPECTSRAEQITTSGILRPESKWAFLHPNEPTSEEVTCIVCQSTHDVIRENCVKEGCKGNVKYLLEEGEAAEEDDEGEPDIWVCLTCWHEEEKQR